MEIEEFSKLISSYGKEISIEFSNIQIEKFYKYMNLLIEWNEKINLTAITEPKEIIIKHFIDSLTVLKDIKGKNTLVDVGTGAGFPGIPLKIMDEEIKITLLDSLNKRINFLNEVINQLDLKNIETIHSRVEDAGKNKKYRERFDIATARAVANLATLSEYMLPLVKVGGKSICMKGSEVSEELQNSKKAISILGGEIENIDNFQLPKSDMMRNIVIIKKVKNTPNKYPRKPGTPSKEPIN
ncbi:MAG: 16S rRNA (guanine(527)-N(7))-methyltransferase RsmG [Clostridia bacterium]|nr:16S rRNA (guanine(527)-N(7))-methyltransferase RsmG [Clostridium sp.]